MKNNNKLKSYDLLGYAVMAFPLAFSGLPLYINAPDYYATEFGLSLSLLGIALLGLRFLDAVQDFFIGYLLDYFAAYRLKITLIAGLILGLGFSGLFWPPVKPTLLWFSSMMFLATTSFGILTINLGTLGSLWSDDPQQKTRISIYRETMTMIGLLVAVLMPALLKQHMTAVESFHWLSLTLAFGLLITLIIFLGWFKKWGSSFKIKTQINQKTQSILIYRNKQNSSMWKFYFIFFISSLASSLPGVLILFYIRDALKAENHTGIFLLLYFISGIFCMPAWLWLARRIGKSEAWFCSMVLALIGFLGASALTENTSDFFGLVCMITGMAFGAELALPSAILADFVDHNNCKPIASQMFGVLAFISKASFAIAAIIAFPWLDIHNFKAGSVNSPEAISALCFLYAQLPCVIKLMAAVSLFAYIKKSPKG